MFKTLFGQVSLSLPAFVVALGAAGLALLWIEVSWVLAAAVAGALLLVGLVAYALADALLARPRPRVVAATRSLTFAVAAPLGLAAFVAAAVIVFSIETAPAEDWSEQRKQLTAAFAAAFTTFLTTAFVKGADEADAGWTGKLVKKRFEVRFENRFPRKETAVRSAAFDRTRGWDAETRMERAREIDAYIAGNGTVYAAGSGGERNDEDRDEDQ